MDQMIAQSCGTMGGGILKSSTEQEMAEVGHFAGEQFGKRVVIR